jgi:hypothetical protein
LPVQQGARIRRPRFVQPRSRRAAKATIRERDRLLDRGMPSICRGC